jgi:hypothetical protein
MGRDGADRDKFPEEAARFHFTTNLRICLGNVNRLIELLLTCIVNSGKIITFVHLIPCLSLNVT